MNNNKLVLDTASYFNRVIRHEAVKKGAAAFIASALFAFVSEALFATNES